MSTQTSLCGISPLEEEDLLAELNHWNIVRRADEGRELHRLYTFPHFHAAFEFMSRAVDDIIIPQNHHPRWQNTYHLVEIWICTSDFNHEITHRDALFARSLENLWLSAK